MMSLTYLAIKDSRKYSHFRLGPLHQHVEAQAEMQTACLHMHIGWRAIVLLLTSLDFHQNLVEEVGMLV